MTLEITTDIKGNQIDPFYLSCNRQYLNELLFKSGTPMLSEFDAAYYHLLGSRYFGSQELRDMAVGMEFDHFCDMAS